MTETTLPGTKKMAASEYDAIVVGAGFAGLYMLFRLRQLGLSVRVFEAGTGVGGTWFWNRYPGARCDVESMNYSYSFSPELEQEWHWTERYPAQPELLSYLNHVADRFGLRRDIQLNTRIVQAHFDEEDARWCLQSKSGERFSAQYCIMATGCLSAVNEPDFKGLDQFRGKWYQTSRWPQGGVDFAKKRVGFVGTGSSGIQAIPVIAAQASHLHVFQRTPSFSVPAGNGPLDPDFERDVKSRYRELRAKARDSASGLPLDSPTTSALEVSAPERERHYARAWDTGNGPDIMWAYSDLLTNAEANESAAEFVRRKIREIVKDPAVAARLTPTSYPIGTKRLCLDTNYFNTYNRDNVTLIDVRSAPIREITPEGIRTAEATYELDALVFAIGFDAMTGPMLSIDIRGKGGQSLKASWAHGPKTYLGLAVAGFPNLFAVTGPGSPSVLSNVVTSIEQHVEWISECVEYLRVNGFDCIEADFRAQEAWVAHVNEVADFTLFPQASSWYLGANIPGKTRVFMPYLGGVGAYRQKCTEIAQRGYEGFTLTNVRTHVRRPGEVA